MHRVPRPTASDADSLRRFFFLGRLMGIALRSGNPLEVALAPTVWLHLVRERPSSLGDLALVDKVRAVTQSRRAREVRDGMSCSEIAGRFRPRRFTRSGDELLRRPPASSMRRCFLLILSWCERLTTAFSSIPNGPQEEATRLSRLAYHVEEDKWPADLSWTVTRSDGVVIDLARYIDLFHHHIFFSTRVRREQNVRDADLKGYADAHTFAEARWSSRRCRMEGTRWCRTRGGGSTWRLPFESG